MKLIILQPEGTLFNGDIESVTLPGEKGSFTLLKRHAPLISILAKGIIKYRIKNSQAYETIGVNGGFVKIRNDSITICTD
ncbi:MAG: ATP synthase F1 subunit epsilon [Bacteroidetes bacterium GWF2_40_14]|nr:MAG: ATP synthase F1 subunit epsilon [Bacteroidetes bacterium GWF2_40_14]